MKKLTKALAASAIVAAGVFAGPIAANAASYVPPVNTTDHPTSSAATPGGTFTLPFQADFTPNAALTASFSSSGAVPSSATVTSSFVAAVAGPVPVGNADARGAATLTGTVPASASADITVTLTDGVHTALGTIDVAAAAPAAVPVAATGGSHLATTGTYISFATIWGAVGLVALGGGLLAVRITARRKGAAAGTHSA